MHLEKTIPCPSFNTKRMKEKTNKYFVLKFTIDCPEPYTYTYMRVHVFRINVRSAAPTLRCLQISYWRRRWFLSDFDFQGHVRSVRTRCAYRYRSCFGGSRQYSNSVYVYFDVEILSIPFHGSSLSANSRLLTRHVLFAPECPADY